MTQPRRRLTLAFASLSLAWGLSACGGGSDAVPGVADGSLPPAFGQPVLSFNDPDSPIDLKSYTQVGRYSLPVGTGANRLAEEASAVTYNRDTDTLFVVGDGGTAITQVSKKGVLIDSMALAADAGKPQGTYFYDPEGLTYLGGGKFAMVEERFRQVNEFTYAAHTTLGAAGVRTVKLGTTIGNIGIEGLSLDPMTRGFVAVKESGPSGVFQTTLDFAAGTASNGAPTLENSVNLFDPAKTGLSALNDVFALSNIVPASAADHGHLMILSAPDGKIVKMSRSGELLGTLAVGSAAQNEGMTMDASGAIYVVSEIGGGAGRPELLVFAPTTSKDAVGIASNLYLTFSRPVLAGTGSVMLSNGAGDTRTLAINDSAQVKFRGNTVVMDPAADLVAGTTYSVTFAAGVLKDAQGNPAPASAGASAPTFKAIGTVDDAAPTLLGSLPVDGASGITGSRVQLTFNEPVVAGTGAIVISNGTDTRVIAVGDTTQVTFSGSAVTLNPSAELLKGTTYNVQLASGVIKDVAGNAFAGITDATTLDFTTASPTAITGYTVLITEINSNAGGGDFFELYNYGTAAINLTGWKWDDDSAASTDAAAVTFPALSLAAGERLVVVAAANATAFNTAWSNPVATVVALGGPGLGKGDAVVLFDSSGKVAAALNYGPAGITASDGTVIGTAAASAGVTYAASEHAGLAYAGLSAATSAVWDGQSTSAPAYRAGQVGVRGGVAQASDATAIGSPGQ